MLQIRLMEQGLQAKTSYGTKTWVWLQANALFCQLEAWTFIRDSNSNLPIKNKVETPLVYLEAWRMTFEIFFYVVILLEICSFVFPGLPGVMNRKNESQTENVPIDSLPTYDESQKHAKVEVDPPKYEDVAV